MYDKLWSRKVELKVIFKCYVEIRLGKSLKGNLPGWGKKWPNCRMEENKITHLGSVFTGPKCQEENLDYILQNLENKFLYKKQPNENSDLIRLLLQRWEW